jgi:hypothetical protein
VKASLGSSSGPPGACITPSRVKKVCTVSFMSFQTKRALILSASHVARPEPFIEAEVSALTGGGLGAMRRSLAVAASVSQKTQVPHRADVSGAD